MAEMTIVFIASRSLNNIGGIETYMKNLAPILAEKNNRIILYVNGGWFKKSMYKGVQIIEVPGGKSKLFNKIITGAISTVHSLIINKNVDIYHYHANAVSILSFLPKFFNYIVVFQGHGFEWKRAKWSPLMQWFIKRLDDFVIKINNNIIMVSQEQSDYIKLHYKKNSTTITSAVTIKEKKFNTDILEQYGLQKNEYILFLGRLVPEKKADIIIDAFNNLDYTNIKLVIAGDDPNEKKYINALMKKAFKNKNIIFTGSVLNDKKESLLQNCKIFCIPSELEGLPITLLEAMSYGKVCIASNIAANKEALGNTGIYFNVNSVKSLTEQLQYVLENYNDIIMLGQKAKQRIKQNFTWESIADQLEDYYKYLLEKNIKKC